MGGRIDDFAVVESNPSIFYVGLATSGVWKTINNGTTFEPIFDTYSVASIGDIAVCQMDPNMVWVGTGEANNRQSSTYGDGIYKSVDAGKTFTNVGLKETQTIARIVIDPKDPNTVYVAALGHLFGPNPERGIFKTTDGGKTWSNVKFIDENTGFTDLVMDAVDNKILYAASYQRQRSPWGFNGGGPGSGIWKTIDAGKTWTRLTGNGLPAGILGRIGLDVSRSNPNVVYAQIEVGPSSGTGGGVGGPGGFGPGGQPAPPAGQGAQPGAQPAGQAAQPGQAAAQAPGQPGQPAPQPPNPERSGIWRSDDKGKTWRIMSNNNNRPMYYSQIRVDPNNDQIVYTCGAPFHKSTDGGKTFQVVQGIAHSDHHAVWIDPKNKNLLYLGTEFALYISLNGGAEWKRFMTGLPTVRIDDILVHPRDNDLIVGTHGRSIYILDDVTPLQQLTDKALESDAHLFDVRPGTQWLQDVTLSRSMGGAKVFRGANPQPGTAISYYLKSEAVNDVKITITDITGKVIRDLTGSKTPGLNRVQWTLRGNPPPRPPGAPGFAGGGGGGFGGFGGIFQQGLPVEPGTYLVKLSVDGKELTTKVRVDADEWENRQ